MFRAANHWRLSKVDIRMASGGDAWPVARIELAHEELGLLSDLASAQGPLEAAFGAISQIMAVPARIERITLKNVNGASGAGVMVEDGGAARVEIAILVADRRHLGRAQASDVIECLLAAYIDALNDAQAFPG